MDLFISLPRPPIISKNQMSLSPRFLILMFTYISKISNALNYNERSAAIKIILLLNALNS